MTVPSQINFIGYKALIGKKRGLAACEPLSIGTRGPSYRAGLCRKRAEFSCHFHNHRKSLKSRFTFESLRDGRVGPCHVNPQSLRICGAAEAYADEAYWNSNQQLRWLPR